MFEASHTTTLGSTRPTDTSVLVYRMEAWQWPISSLDMHRRNARLEDT